MASNDDVTTLLTKTACYCLNECAPQQFNHLFVGDHSLSLRSDADEQLLLHLAFNQTLALKQIKFGVPSDSSCPRSIKLFINQNNLGFLEAAGNVNRSNSLDSFFLLIICQKIHLQQTITLNPSSSAAGELVTINLNAAKWQRTDSSKSVLLPCKCVPYAIL
jgi:hypothetical protein